MSISLQFERNPFYTLKPNQRDVTNVKRSGEWLHMKSKNLELGRTLTLRFVVVGTFFVSFHREVH